MKDNKNLKILAGILSAIIFVMFFIIVLKPDQTINNPYKKNIVTSFYPMYISTINITKNVDDVQVINLTKPQTGCLHDYSLTPQDMQTLQTADIFVVNGANMESFLNKVLTELPKLKIINSSDGITPIYDPSTKEANPHFWLSISDNIKQVNNISSQLQLLDPNNAAQYKKNADEYIDKLKALRTEMHAELDNLKHRDIITFHEAFPYFAKELNLTTVAVIEREPGSEPSAQELAQTINIIKNNKKTALFAEPQYPAKSAQTIAKETATTLYILDPAVSGELSPDAYIEIMKKNLATLKKALN